VLLAAGAVDLLRPGGEGGVLRRPGQRRTLWLRRRRPGHPRNASRRRARCVRDHPGAHTTVTASEIHLNGPQALYRRWEDAQWSPFAIDLTRDAAQWAAADAAARDLVLFALSSLMVAEERITTKFSGLVGAYGTEEEATFLATQQVDEARHMQFYARFQNEVIAEPAAIGVHVERARAHLSDAFRQIFDVALVDAHEALVASPGDLEAKVRFVTIYHQIIEATLGLTSFKFITDYLKERDLLRGFVDGYSKIHDDETRHIAYGAWFLRETVRERPEQAATVRETLREVLPHVADALKLPPEGQASSALGVSEDELREHALGGLKRRLQIIGVPLETVFA
jgi:ribonucleoside-diphosphate reductase beta chain